MILLYTKQEMYTKFYKWQFNQLLKNIKSLFGLYFAL